MKGVYLVPDPKMMKPSFGPSEHIKVGLLELEKYFEMELIVLGEYIEIENSNKRIPRKSLLRNFGLVGVLRDLKLLYCSNRNRRILINKLKEIGNVDFIYERGQYLDFRGIMVAKKLGIKHFYEVNWINYLGIRQFYKSWFNPISRKLEELSYSSATLNFIVGTQSELLNINSKKIFTIQNGIYNSTILSNQYNVNQVTGKISIFYVANLMPHHRFDILLQALLGFKYLNRIELNLVGYNFENYTDRLPKNLSWVNHGPIPQADLKDVMRNANLGLISGGPQYSSFMKFFEYASLKLAIVCPDLKNLRTIFSDTEVLFFRNESSDSLREILEYVVENDYLLDVFGQKVYEKVANKYTWENIYREISEKIKLNC